MNDEKLLLWAMPRMRHEAPSFREKEIVLRKPLLLQRLFFILIVPDSKNESTLKFPQKLTEQHCRRRTKNPNAAEARTYLPF
jgi:hypothetical protein